MIILTLGAVITSILVVVATSTVYSVLWLVATFILVSMILGLYGLTFPALLYIIVYIGAIAILFLFVIQLLDLKSITESDEVSAHVGGNKGFFSNSNVVTILTMQPFILIGSLLLVISLIITSNFELVNLTDQISYSNISNFNPYLNVIRDSTIYSDISLMPIANSLYGIAILPLILISLILLIAMIAPIYLCL